MENATDELKNTKSMSSNPENPNPPQRHTKTREEGELSSSTEGDENPVCSATQSAGSVNPPAPAGSIPIPSLNKFTEGIQARKATSGTNPANSVDVLPHTSIQPNKDKSFEKSRVPFKSVNPGWHGPQGANTNLVISFSDDDTGSESEDHMAEKALEIKQNTAGVDGTRRLPSLSSEKSSKLQKTARNVNKVMPKKLSLSRTFISSTAKINGGAHSRSAGPSSIDQGSLVRNFNTMNRKFTSPEHSFDQGLGLNNTKLRDLRQQIALRERELKLKAIHQNKESASVSGRDYTVVNLGADTVRKSNAILVDVRQREPKESDRKRLKVSGSYSTQLASDRRQEITAVKSIIPLKEHALLNSALPDRNMVDHSQKESPSRRAESSDVKWQKQDDKRVDISSENIPRVNINSNCAQTDRSIMQVDPCALLDQTATVTNVNSIALPKKTNSIELNHPVNIGGHWPPLSLLKTSTSEQHLMNGCEYREGVSNDRTVQSSLNNISQASLNDIGLWNYLGAPNVSEHSNIDMHSLVEMEESLDKELEEAQEHRRICEIEERNALKAYRKAQRALVEANARCTELYHKRELYSAQFRSFILNDSSLLWSTRKPEHVGIGLNHMDNTSRNLELMPPSSHSRRPEYDGHNQPGYDSNIQCANGGPLKMSYRHVNGQNMGSEPCSEPDASTSEPLHLNRENAANAVSSPSNDPDISADEDEETSPLGQATVQPTSTEQREQNSVGRQKNTNHSNKNLSIGGSQDSLILEATLRSELFARLGRRIFPKNSGLSNPESADELGAENDNGSERTQTSNGSVPLLEAERNQEFDLGGNDQRERDVFGSTVQIQKHKKKRNEYSVRGHQLAAVLFSPTLILRSAFYHMKVESPFNSLVLQSRKNQQGDTYDVYNGAGGCINAGDIQQSILIAKPVEDSFGNIFENGIGSFTCDLAVDPFWPLCMYDLRGKCNNDQCPWQHVRDFSNENAGQHQHDGSDSADCQVGLTLQKRKRNGAAGLAKCLSFLTPPTYLVGLDVLKADPHSYESVVARRHGQCWKKCFSICLALSNLFQIDLPADEPFLHSNDGRIEVNGSWDKPSSYFRSRNSIVNHLNQMLPGDVQSLEKALLILNQEVNKLEGMKKALSILSRAIEADPKSEILWITYLLIYYGNIKSIAKEDMFSYAVKHNDRSYGLWLMYINSRMHLVDRLSAYDAALTALCHHASARESDEMYASACILDIFLQMMDCLCMSGNVEKAIQKICGFFPVASNSDQQPHSLLLSDILACLKISDKYMFWVCCVYLVIYRTLPEAVVQKFECDKELLAIEWPCTHLLDEEKLRAIKLVEMAVDSVKLSVDTGSLASEADLTSAQHFGLCHIRCMVALGGLECCGSLLDEYTKLYPFCLELVLISARLQMNDFENFEGFEEAIRSWPKETPGIHCIWNQYIECALRKGDVGFVKELIVRCFNSSSEVQYHQQEKLDVTHTNSSDQLSRLASASNPEFLTSNSNRMDMTFGYLNYSLAKLLHNDHIEARNAIDKAFKAAAPPIFKHCLREHANFLLNYELQLKEDAFISEQLNVLNGYLDDARALPVSEPLSRRFINKIEKPRVRQLISNLLSPVSCDFSLVNIVLEVWHGPSLVPQKFSQPQELVDFVEAILEIVPSNYQLAFSACKLLSRGEHFSEVSSGSMLYWASSTLVSAIFHAIPIAPEYVWVNAAGILEGIEGTELISERFYRRALSAYPLSIKLWNCYYNLSKIRGDANSIVEAAREKGIELG
ncbi:uncharacterized protein LOC110640171 isoform X2 [Hevea brasiliensis]|uniref:uncharacterized protein LOC110640171 isoform X2 n=1 Tax=Hevea brasiliensis TaxID=3981 RepID=UPI0025DD52FC|nr:uncharacterized protein LOC110640171 isoform X2 [Hevea brasiliensis]